MRGALLLALALAAAAAGPAAAQSREERVTPLPPPTALPPRLTPVFEPDAAKPKAKPPAAAAPFLPAPVVAAPMSPVRVPGARPPAFAAAPAPALAPGPVPPPAAAPESVAPPPPRKPAEVAAAPQPPVAAAPRKAGAGARTVWAKDDVYVRAGPGRDARILTALEPGEAVELVPGGNGGEWKQVARGGKVLGWVAAGFLVDRPPSARPDAGKSDDGCALPRNFTAPAGPPPGEGATVRALAAANIRQTPACNAPVLDVLETGETVTVVGTSGTWSRVARRGRTLGYVSSILLAPAGR